MKTVKRITYVILLLLVILFTSILIIIGIDVQRTNYLKVNKEDSSNSFFITNVNVVPMSQDTILLNTSVYIKDGIIHSIGNNSAVEGVEIINAKGGYLTPGLIDMHVHVWDKYELGLYLANGVTAIRNAWGMPSHLRLKKQIVNGDLLSPEFYTTGPKLTGPDFIGDDNLQLTSPEEAIEKVKRYKKKGYDFIKTYYGLTEELYEAILTQSQLSDMDIVAHPTQKVPYAYHFNKQQIVSIEHAEEIIQQPLNYKLDSLELNKVIKLFEGDPRISFCPTLVSYFNIYRMLTIDTILKSNNALLMNPLIMKVDAEGQFDRWSNTKKSDPSITARIKNQHEFHLLIIRKLHEAGVNIIAGTDAGIGVTVPGLSLHQELAFYQEAGLTNYEVLKTATINASKVHKVMNNMGTVEEGKVANLLLVSNNPLLDLSVIKQPELVFVNGIKLEKSTLRNLETKAKNRGNLVATAIRYIENLIFEK